MQSISQGSILSTESKVSVSQESRRGRYRKKRSMLSLEGSILEGIFSITFFFLQGSIFVERRIDPCGSSLKIVSSSPKHRSLSLDFQSFKFKWPFSTLCSCMIPIEFFSTWVLGDLALCFHYPYDSLFVLTEFFYWLWARTKLGVYNWSINTLL